METSTLFFVVISLCMIQTIYLIFRGLRKESLVIVFLMLILSLGYYSNIKKQKIESELVVLLSNLVTYQKKVEKEYIDRGGFSSRNVVLEDDRYLISKKDNLIKVVFNKRSLIERLFFSFPESYVLMFNPDEGKWSCVKDGLSLSDKIIRENNIAKEYVKNCVKDVVIIRTEKPR